MILCTERSAREKSRSRSTAVRYRTTTQGKEKQYNNGHESRSRSGPGEGLLQGCRCRARRGDRRRRDQDEASLYRYRRPGGNRFGHRDACPDCRSTFPRSDLHVEGLIELGRPRTESSSEFGSIVVKESCLHTQPILSRMNYLERSALGFSPLIVAENK